MVAAQFQDTGSDVKEINLQKFITGDFVGTTDNKTAPEIEVWDPAAGDGVGSYVIYHFYSQSSGSADSAYHNYWGATRTKSQWEANQAITIPLGVSVWFKCQQDCTIQCAGQVAEVTDQPITTVGGGKWNMIANPFPVALNINSNVNWVAAGIVGTTDNKTAPEIEVWDVTAGNGVGSYVIYHFYSLSSGSADTAYHNYWALTRTKAQWAANQLATVPVGCGFWFKYSADNVDTSICPSGNLTLTFTK